MSHIRSYFIQAAKAWSVCIVWAVMASMAPAQTVSTTTVQGTVYLANGSPGSGTLQLRWPAFTTASNQTVAADKLTLNIGADGVVSVKLAPNLGSSPAGLYYTAIYHMSDGTTSIEYWVVPPATQVSIAQVRAQVMPAAQAVQAVSKAYVDQAIQSVARGNLTSTGGQLTGPLYLTGDPTQSLQAADKQYVDSTFAQALPLTGGAITGTLQVGGATQSAGSMTVRNNADAEVDYDLWPGLTADQKGSFTYKDFNGNSQWYMVKDASNNWALNSATGGLDSFKAYQSTNGGDTYINASNSSGVVRVNYETGSGSTFNIYGGDSGSLSASFTGRNSIKFPGLAASNGPNCLQIDSAGVISNTGVACSSSGASGTVNAGSSGQIAYYTGDGAAVSGLSSVPISAGGTGTTNAAAALQALGGVSQTATEQQTMKAPLMASVNSQINVMDKTYNAKGDCSTDDTAAFNAAQAAAIAKAVGNARPAALYLPLPPGGCYIVSNWFWKGVSLIGQPTGLGPASPKQYSITLKSLPGYDVIHIPDPTYTAGSAFFYGGANISDVSFLVDNSAPSPYTAHRWPGRWFDDLGATAGSAVITTTNADVSCGDIGQAILINGAGPSGAPLSTTIASVTPCWKPSTSLGLAGWQVITLATAASTTVTNAHSYLSLLGLPVTTTVGPCGIAFDTEDANQSNWVGNYSGSFNYARLNNVVFTGTTGSYANNVCGIFAQASSPMYGWDIENFGFYGLKFGVVQAMAELNAKLLSGAGDFEKWDHGLFFIDWNPWISYNGLAGSLQRTEFTTSSGIQMLNDGTISGDTAAGWELSLGMESPDSPTVYGHRIEGNGHAINGSMSSGASGQIGYLDCTQCVLTGTALTNTQNNGWANTITASGFGTGFVDNSGYATHYKWIYNGGSSPGGLPLPYWVSGSFYKGSNDLLGRFTSDFIGDGNYTTPYNHDDLLIMPRDVVVNYLTGYPYSTYFLPDTAAKSGVALIVSGSTPTNVYYGLMQYAELGGSTNSLVVGTNIPDTGGTFVFSARCATSTTFSMYVRASTQANASLSCTNAYAQYAVPITFSSGDIGHPIVWGGQSGTPTFYMEWASFVPNAVLSSPTLNTPKLNSPALTGTATAPNVTAGDNSTKIANTAFVTAALAATGAPSPYYDWYPGGEAMGSNAVADPITSNGQQITSFTAKTTATYSKLTYYVNTADNSANLYNIGWANGSGTIICSAGPTAGTIFAPTTGYFTATMSPSCSFVAGNRYYLLATGNASTIKFGGQTVGSAYHAGSACTTTGAVLCSFTPPTDNFQVSVNPTVWVVMHN